MQALDFAITCHKGQTRKGGEPYIHHPLRVAAYAKLYVVGGPPGAPFREIPSAAYLHDVMEDCGVPYGVLNNMFGSEIANLVQNLTNVYTKGAYPNFKRRERKRKEAERLAECCELTQQIKLCDRLDNIMDRLMFTDRDWAARYIRETYELLDHIGHSNEELTAVIKERINGYTQAYQPDARR